MWALVLSQFFFYHGLIHILVMLNRGRARRRGVVVDGRWTLEAWLKWGATVANGILVLVLFLVRRDMGSDELWLVLMMSPFLLTLAIWSSPQAIYRRRLAWIAFPIVPAIPAIQEFFFLTSRFMRDRSPMFREMESSVLPVVAFNALVIGLNLLAIWVPYRKQSDIKQKALARLKA